MADQAALQEAIQRARQLAAKISQNAPVKRTASEMEDNSIGNVKVTLAYEKPVNPDRNKEHRSSSNHRDREYTRDRDDRDSGYSASSGPGAGSNSSHSRPPNSSSNFSPMLPMSSNHSPMLTGANNYPTGGEVRIEIIIPHAVIGLVIGKGGENIKRIQNESGATVRVDPNTVDEKGNKVCTITGTKKAVDEAHAQVTNVIENAATNKRPRTHADGGSDQYRMKIPASRTGAIIGKGGETIKSIKQQSGCDIELDKHAKESSPEESVFILRGSQDRIAKAKALIEARLASRGRDNDSAAPSNRSAPRGVATGANAAPVAHFTDLPASYPAAGQQTTADMSTAWAAYFAQYSNLMNQAGTQPGAAGLTYGGQSLMGAAGSQQPQIPQPSADQQTAAQPSQSSQQVDSSQGTQQPQDYTDQWIEFYLMNGRPDYAEQIIEMKKQQQAQKQQQSQQPQSLHLQGVMADKTQ